MRESLTIRRITPSEVAEAVELFARELYETRDAAESHLADHEAEDGTTFVAFVDGRFAGHLTIRWTSNDPQFRAANIPLIQDLNVFDDFERRGIATRLMDEAEKLIATRADFAGTTVGLFDAYGPAQRLYAKRGYLPDGRGACLSHRPLRCGETVTMDHDLILWLTKRVANDSSPRHELLE